MTVWGRNDGNNGVTGLDSRVRGNDGGAVILGGFPFLVIPGERSETRNPFPQAVRPSQQAHNHHFAKCHPPGITKESAACND